MTLTFHNTEGLLPHKDTCNDIGDFSNHQFYRNMVIKICLLANIIAIQLKPIYKLRSDSSHSQNILYTSLANEDRGGVAIFVQNDLQFTERVYDTHNLEYVAILIEKSIVCIHRKYLQTTFISLTSIL